MLLGEKEEEVRLSLVTESERFPVRLAVDSRGLRKLQTWSV